MHRDPQILKYLKARNHLCKLGYDEAQVEEALEMFQNCESKVFIYITKHFPYFGSTDSIPDE